MSVFKPRRWRASDTSHSICLSIPRSWFSLWMMGKGVFVFVGNSYLTMKRSIQMQFAAYQQIFDHLNKTLFQGLLPDCMLSFSRRRQSSHTLYTSGQWHEKAGSATPEISLNLKQLQEEVPIEAMAVLVRQMVHLWQEKFGTSSRKGYYNREWADKMEEVGLIPTKTGLPGGKRTGQTVKHFVQSGGRFEQVYREMPKHCLSPFRPTIHEVEEKTGARNKVMYRCPGCGTKVWGKGGLGLICECGKVFVDDRSESKPGVIEEVCRVLVLQCR